MNTFVRCYNPADFMYRFVTGGFNCLPQSKWVVVNTFEDLELQTIHGLRELYGLKNLLAIGPLLPQNLCATSRSDFQAKLTSFFWREDETCLSWLDKHEPKSVLYVSFGSLALISSEQIEEVALALEASGHPFLWVARSDLIHGRSPTFNEDYLLRVKDHSCFVTWAPQLQVLRHPSIGVFFTHGGWNSTIEAITAGVPMLGWPYFSDQPMDCTCIEGWGLGLKLSDGMGDGKIVPKCTIESKIRSVMSSKAFRERAHNLKMLAEKGLPGIRCSKDFQTLLDSL
ncbi:hypothetical protein KP509_08G043300 [Ceratopteris richardii]|nr:hypothetical protein KP509_08G043300 [Ceratopteris richardii]